MSSFGSEIRKRMKQLKKNGQNVQVICDKVQKDATIEAVRVATENTPPNNAPLAGTGMRTGQMAQHWTMDSETTPVRGRTVLANNMQYSSYVNDGHRMDKHFVPGLIVNGTMLERVPKDMGGIMVGTRTSYVPGLHMKEKAIKKYRSVIKSELDRRVKETLER